MYRYPRLAFALLLSALLPSLADAEVTQYQLKGPTASASFSEWDPAQCLSTQARISIFQLRTGDGSAPGLWISLFIDRYSNCGGGEEQYFAYEPLPEGAFRADGVRLSGASLQATVLAQTGWDQPKNVPVVLDLVWTGEGDIGTMHNSEIRSHRFFRVMERSRRSQRAAAVSGSLLLWEESLADQEMSGLLGLNHNGGITILKPR